MSKAVKAVSPKGVASWPKFNKPDTRFDAEGVYKVGLVVPPKEAKAFQDQIQEVFEAEFGKAKLAKAIMPFKEDEDGNIVFNFKSKNKPMMVDSQGTPIKEELNVASGSVLKVGTGINPWNAGGKIGVTLYLNAVQVITYVEYSGNPFGKEEGGFEVSDAEEVIETDADEIPF